jgi:hypothetical protein
MSNAPNAITDTFYVVAREPGAEHPALPTWANDKDNPAGLSVDSPEVIERRKVEAVSGAFQLLNVLSAPECQRFIELTESLGYLPDAAVSLPRTIRHNDNVTWVADQTTADILWQRCANLMTLNLGLFSGKRAVGLNARFRFYRYQHGDYFKPHTDGAWPGSKVVDHELITNAYSDRWSQLSFILFLSNDYSGGHTQFYVDKLNSSEPARSNDNADVINVRTLAGAALCFPHGTHRLHCLHSSEAITSGTKYIIRSDVLFEI